MVHFLQYTKYLVIPFSAEVFLHYRSTIALLLALIILSFLIDFLLSRSFLGPKYRIILAPGVIIHEFAHGFACILTGAKVSEMSLFEKEGGHVRHTKPKIPILGPIIISLAPLVVGILAIYFTSKFLSSSSIDLVKSGFSIQGVIVNDIALVKNVVHFMPKNWILLYITVSVAVTMLPSRQDLYNAFSPLLLLILAFLIASKYTHILLPITSFNLLLLSAINLLIILLFLSIIIFAISNIFRNSAK